MHCGRVGFKSFLRLHASRYHVAEHRSSFFRSLTATARSNLEWYFEDFWQQNPDVIDQAFQSWGDSETLSLAIQADTQAKVMCHRATLVFLIYLAGLTESTLFPVASAQCNS